MESGLSGLFLVKLVDKNIDSTWGSVDWFPKSESWFGKLCNVTVGL